MEDTELANEIRNGIIFIYPTDTIYGIGCDATNTRAVKWIREIKRRDAKPFSVIAPSKQWILKNCSVSAASKKWINKLPGPYTLILRLKNKKSIARAVNEGKDTLGVRIPKHWISLVASQLNRPIVTTSANLSGKPFMTSLANLDKSIKKKVDLILYEGPKKARPSTLVDLTESRPVVIKR